MSNISHDFRSIDSLTLLNGLCDVDRYIRDEALRNVDKILSSWYHGFGSPKDASYLQDNPGENGEDLSYMGDTSMFYLIEEQVPDLVRLSVTAPLLDVQEKCNQLLRDLKSRGIRIPHPAYDSPSFFVNSEEINYMNHLLAKEQSSQVLSFYQQHFHTWRRVENYLLLMGDHPDYLECFTRLHNHLFTGDCPLQYPVRHYIAIMAAARHRCEYFVRLHASEFIATGGDPKWLEGLDRAPSKMRDLCEINRLLAHRPWLLNESHIAKLARGNNRDNFSLSELMHAIALMTHIHCLSSFVFCSGVSPEIDFPNGHTYSAATGSPDHLPFNGDSINPSSPAESETYEVPVSELMDRMKRISEEELEELNHEELTRRFETIEQQNAQLPASNCTDNHPIPKIISPFLDEPDFKYVSFKSTDQAPFRLQDYTWNEDGLDLVNRLSSDLGNLLDDKFNTTCDMTYNTMGTQQNVDTRSFRQAVWNYVHTLYGIRHDDYNYSLIDQLMQRPLKSYLKLTTASPASIQKHHYDRFMKDFKASEKIHVNLMVLEARLQATLLYAVRSIKRYMMTQ